MGDVNLIGCSIACAFLESRFIIIVVVDVVVGGGGATCNATCHRVVQDLW